MKLVRAEYVKTLLNKPGRVQKLYKLSEPQTMETTTYTHVLASATDFSDIFTPEVHKILEDAGNAIPYQPPPETYLFAADEQGEVVSLHELNGSMRGYMDCDRAIRESGWMALKIDAADVPKNNDQFI